MVQTKWVDIEQEKRWRAFEKCGRRKSAKEGQKRKVSKMRAGKIKI